MKRGAYAAALVASALLVAGCAEQSKDVKGAESMAAAGGGKMSEGELLGRTSMVYRAPGFQPRQYSKIVIDPVTVYSGSDANFGSTAPAELQELAAFATSELRRVLGQRYLATAPGPGVARVKVMIAGVEGNTPIAATVSRIVPVGLAANLTQAARGAPGSFTGSVTLAGEIVDSTSTAPLVVFAQKWAPGAMDIEATLTSRDAQRAAVTAFAEAFRARIEAIQGTR